VPSVSLALAASEIVAGAVNVALFAGLVRLTVGGLLGGGLLLVTVTSSNPPPNNPPTVALTSPANNATFTAPAAISIAANASDTDGTVAKVDFFNGSTLLGTSTAAPYGITWSGVAAGTYTLTAVATDNSGASTTSSPVTIIVNSAPGLPTGWTNVDVGTTGATGSSTFANGTFTVTGAGADVWGTADAFQYAYTTLSGDGTIVARVNSIEFVNNWTKAGVMIRNSLSPSAAQAFMLVAASSVKGTPFQRRLSDGNTSVSTSGAFVTAPYWVKLVRSGSTITASESSDGTTWSVVASDTFTMGPSVLIGLAVSSHVTGTTATCTFDHVSIQ